MPKPSSIGKRRSKALPALGFAGMCLSMASGACASASEASANTSLPSQKHEIFLGEEEISDVSLATFYLFDNPQVQGRYPCAEVARRLLVRVFSSRSGSHCVAGHSGSRPSLSRRLVAG